MTDIWTPEKRSEDMSKVRGKGNKSTELVLARILRGGAITGWRRHLPLPGKPDFCFPSKRLVLFVDGCFWHGCPRCYRRPKSRQEFWDTKVRTNRKRDRRVDRELKLLGFNVMRVFEHRLKKPELILSVIRRRLKNFGGRVMFQKGDRVKIKPEWTDRAVFSPVYEICEWNIDRGFMFPVEWRQMGFSIAPQELVREQMIEKIEYAGGS